MVVKTEKIICMRARLKPLLFFNGQSAAKPRIGEGSTTNRDECNGVVFQAYGNTK